jgi:hypothetical protein
MDPIDQLPPDQSAVLSLLLRQGRSYADIAQLLGIPESAVRVRAHAALDAIAGGPGGAPASASASVSPQPGSRKSESNRGRPAPAGATTRTRTTSTPPSEGRAPRSQRSGSRRAGALLLVAIVAVVVVAVVLIANSGGSGSHGGAGASSSRSTTSSSGATSTTAGGGPHVDKQLTLTSPDPASSAAGLVEIVSEGSKQAFLLSAEHLPASTGFFYAAWLYNSPSEVVALGRAPSVSSNGKLQAVGALPSDAAHFHTMLLTRETSTHATRPGSTVLSGAFSVK